MSSGVAIWLYLDANGMQKGPVPATVLLKLLEKGLGGISSDTMVWTSSMTEWLPMHKVDPFASAISLLAKQWYYLDHDQSQNGPILTRMLVHKLQQGELDGLTLVFTEGMTEWTKIGDVAELKEELQKLAREEEDLESARRASEEQAKSVFEAHEDDEVMAKASKDFFKPRKERHFTADDGTRYRWSDADQDWVVAEGHDGNSEDDDDDHDGDEDSEGGRGAGGAGDDEQHDEDDEGDSETDNHTNPRLNDGKNTKSSSNKLDAGDGDVTNADGKAEQKKKRKKRKKKAPPSTWIYVTGLPSNITFEELKEHFSKVGLIALSPYDQQPRIKIYKEEGSDHCKGDCVICFNSEESVKLAVDILDGGYIRPNYKISVTRATFDSSRDNPSSTSVASSTTALPRDKDDTSHKKPRLSQAQIKVARNAAKQALLWNEDDDIGVAKAAALRIVVLEGMFKPSELSQSETLVDELEQDIASECEKCGTIEKITMFTKNPKGIVVVKFSTSYAAQECIRVMGGRFFAGEKIKCYFWDGVTNYSIVPEEVLEEQEKQEEHRLDEFGDWLDREQEELPEEFQLRTE